MGKTPLLVLAVAWIALLAPSVLAHHDPVIFADYDTIYRINSTGTFDIFTAPPGTRIVSFAEDSTGVLYVGLECDGCPYSDGIFLKIPGGIVFRERETSIIGVFVDINDQVYFAWEFEEWVVGVPHMDYVYRLDPGGPVNVYTSPPYWSVVSVAVDSEGSLYVGLFCFDVEPFCPPEPRVGSLIKIPGGTVFTTNGIIRDAYVDIYDNVYFTSVDLGLNRAYKLDSRGIISELFTAPSGVEVEGIAADSQGAVYLSMECSGCPTGDGILLKIPGGIIFQRPRTRLVDTFVPHQVPVLLVHGIYSDDTMWDQVAAALSSPPYEYHVYRVGEVLGQKGLVPNNGEIRGLASQLDDAIALLGAKKADLVAHSMGGLVSRWYTGSYAYRQDVRNIITLGTPSKGAPIAADPIAEFFGSLAGDDPADFGREQMIPGSPFLAELNAQPNQVPHAAIAGTSLPTNLLLKILLCVVQPSYCFTSLVTDSIVPESSVNIPGVTCYESPVTHSAELGPAYYTESGTIAAIAALLEGASPLLPPCPLSAAAAAPQNVQIASAGGILPPGQEQAVFPPLQLDLPFSAALNWTSGTLSLELLSPGGFVVNASTFQNYPNTTYEAGVFGNATVEWLTLSSPEQGPWTVRVKAVNTSQPEPYTVTLFMTKGVSLLVATDKDIAAPAEPFVITARLTNGTSPVLNAAVAAAIGKPDRSPETLLLLDDGLHNDSLAGDGVYGNLLANTSLAGTYTLTVNASGFAGGTYFELLGKAAVFVQLLPDLSISAKDINFSDHRPLANATITISAMVHNIGKGPAENATILFYDGDPAGGMLIGRNATDIPANAASAVSIPWPMLPAGTHTIVVFPSPYNPFLDANYTNEQASRKIAACSNGTISGPLWTGEQQCGDTKGIPPQ